MILGKFKYVNLPFFFSKFSSILNLEGACIRSQIWPRKIPGQFKVVFLVKLFVQFRFSILTINTHTYIMKISIARKPEIQENTDYRYNQSSH